MCDNNGTVCNSDTEETNTIPRTDDRSHINIVLSGKTGAGKSYTGNYLLERSEFPSSSSTNSVTSKCKTGTRTLTDGTVIKVIDTPGLFDTRQTIAETLEELFSLFCLTTPGPHVFLYVIRLDHRITAECKCAFKLFKLTFRQSINNHVILVFNRKPNDRESELMIQESQYLMNIIQQCHGRYVCLDYVETVREGDYTGSLLNMILDTVKVNGGRHYTSDMYSKTVEPYNTKLKLEETIRELKQELRVLNGLVKKQQLNNRQTGCLERGKMPEAQSKKIQVKYTDLLKHIVNPLELCRALFSAFVFDAEDKRKIESETVRSQQTDKLLMILMERGQMAFDILLVKLAATGHTKAKQILDECEDVNTIKDYRYFAMRLKFPDLNYYPEYTDPNSDKFKELEDKLKSTISELGLDSVVISFSHGSVIVSFVFTTSTTTDEDNLSAILHKVMTSGYLGQYKVSTDNFLFCRIGEWLVNRKTDDTEEVTPVIGDKNTVSSAEQSGRGVIVDCVLTTPAMTELKDLHPILDRTLKSGNVSTDQSSFRQIGGYLSNHHVTLTENSELLRTTLADGIETVARKLHGCFVVSDYQMENILKTAAKQPDDGVSELIKILKGSLEHFNTFIECLKDIGYSGLVQKLTGSNSTSVITIPQIETRPSPSTSSSTDTGSALVSQTETLHGNTRTGYLPPHHHAILTENSELLRTILADGIKNIAHNLIGRFVLSDHQLNAVLKTASQQPDDGVFELIKILKGSPVVNFERFIECLKDLGYLGLVQKLTENTIPQIETRPSPSTSSSIDTGSALSLQTVTQQSPSTGSTSTDTGSALVSQTETLHGNTQTEIRVSIIGKTGVGKSALGNALLQHDTFKSQQKTTSVTSECESGQRILQLNGVDTLLKVVDTPGLFDTSNSNKTIAKEIVKCINLLSPGPHLFLLVFRIDYRLSQEDIKVLEYFKNTFGELINKFTVVVFTGTDHLDNRSDGDAVCEFRSQLSTFSDVFKNRRFATINNKDTTTGKAKDVERILQLLQTTIHNNGGDFYKNEMYEEAKKLFETRIQDQEVINQNRLAELAKLTKQIEHFKQAEEEQQKQREEQQKQREEQLKQRENNLRNRELALKQKDELSYIEQAATTSAYQYVEYLESPPHAKKRKIIPRREKGMVSPEDNSPVIPHHTDHTYGEISDSSQGNHLMIREMCDRRHYDVSHSGVGNRSEIYNGEVDVVKVKKAHSTLILSKKKPDYQNVQIKEETLSTCRRNVMNIANCVLYETKESMFSRELEVEHEEEDRVKTSELNTRPASHVELDADIQTTDDSPRDITVDMIDDQKAGKDDVVSPLVVKQEPEDDDQDNTTLLTLGQI